MNYKRLEPRFVRLDVVDSTNNYAAQLLRDSVPVHGTTVYADVQTNGKGQRGNSWQSDPGLNLTFSIILFPEIPVSAIFYLNMAVSLAMTDVLCEFTSGVSIKWPNDILIGNQKVAGILIENQLRGQQIISSIAGVGLNVNQVFFDAEMNATSLKLVSGQETDLLKLLEKIHFRIDFYIDILMQKNFKLISNLYHKNLFGKGILLSFEDSIGRFSGIIQGVDDNGKLCISTQEVVKKYDLKEIRFCL